MNINDVTENIEVPENIWDAIFEKQIELAKKYSEIEGMGDLLYTVENNINTAKGQKWIKDFAWRFTEELAEAYEAKDEDEEHYAEELIDALHFLVEMTIIAGYDEKIVTAYNIVGTEPLPWHSIYMLGLMCNTLKNKPWKQTQMLTDKPKFEKLLGLTWSNFKYLLNNELGPDEVIFLYYFKKNAVNQFRQRSKY